MADEDGGGGVGVGGEDVVVVARGAEAATGEVAAPEGGAGLTTMSKNALKRARRREHAEVMKRQRRDNEREAKIQKREARKAEFEAKIAAMGDEEREKFLADGKAVVERKRAEDKAKREARKAQLDSRYNCLIDCEFSDLMIDKESKSMCHQMRFVYETNCKTPTPMKLTFTGIKGAFAADVRKFVGGFDNWHVVTHENSIAEALSEEERARLVYLTPDSDVELETLEPEKTYVIGGFVDRNRHKLLTFNKAKELGIAHARLPINLKMISSSVLTVNQTFEILVNYLERKDWDAAVAASVPTRKTASHNSTRDANAKPVVAGTLQHEHPLPQPTSGDAIDSNAADDLGEYSS